MIIDRTKGIKLMPQNIDNSKRRWATQDEILVAFRDRLRTVEGLNDQTCFIADSPIPLMLPAGGGHCVTVSLGAGSFDQSLFNGGGHSTLNEDSQVVITILVQTKIDRVPQAERALIADDRGLISRWKRAILRSLLVADPNLGQLSQAWEPVSGDRPLCRDQIRPLNCTAPSDVPDFPGWTGLQIVFSASFDWELYSE